LGKGTDHGDDCIVLHHPAAKLRRWQKTWSQGCGGEDRDPPVRPPLRSLAVAEGEEVRPERERRKDDYNLRNWTVEELIVILLMFTRIYKLHLVSLTNQIQICISSQ
jgi:hypothetical protein